MDLYFLAYFHFTSDYCVAHVHLIFTLPHAAVSTLPPNVAAPQHLAYVELFMPFTAHPNCNHRMYTVKWCFDQDGDYVAAIIPIFNLYSSTHLYPQFGPTAPCGWTSGTALDCCDTFHVGLVNSLIS